VSETYKKAGQNCPAFLRSAGKARFGALP